jgi:membrane protein YqaA with SNARE-associated domain
MRLLKWIVILPVAAILIAFAFANRGVVTINLDPLGGGVLPTLEAPQFLVLLIAAAIGVVAGSAATWLGQSRHRRRARLAEAEANRLRYEVQSARAALSPTSSLVRQA